MTQEQANAAEGDSAPAEVRLSVVVPAFNEEANVRPVLSETIQTLSMSEEAGSFEIIVVDDGSTDGTAAKLDKVAAEDPRVRVLRHPQNRGIGAALRTGYAAARGEWVVATCADGEVPASDVIELMKLTPGMDLVVSTRQRQQGGSRRQLFSRVYHRLTSLIVGFDLAGMEGLYVVRRDLLQDMELRSNTPLLNLEIIMHCVSRGCRIARGQMHVRPRLSGQSKMATCRSILKVIVETFKLRLALIRSNRRRQAKGADK